MKSPLAKAKLFRFWRCESQIRVVMADTSQYKFCYFCTCKIGIKGYRSLSSSHSKDFYSDVYELLAIPLDIKGFACNLCANKLNRVRKLTDDLKTKIDSIKTERQKIVVAIKSMPGMAVQPTFIAKTPPRNWDRSKRPYSVVKQTPTPKSKIKKGLFLSPGGRQSQVCITTYKGFILPNNCSYNQR